MEFKKILPWIGVIALLLGGVVAYADLRVQLEELKKIAAIENRLSLHWCIMMGNHEELHEWTDDPEKWGEHLQHCDRALHAR